MDVKCIVSEETSKLTSKTFGGVSKESPMKSIKAAVRAGEEAVAKVTQELQVFKGKTAQEMAELTSKNDRFILQTKAEAAVEAAQKQAAEQVKAAKAAARALKVFEKALPNGGKEGSSSITKAVNKKKVKAQKPTLVSQTEPKRIYESDWGKESGYEITKTYSDGSKEVVQKFTEGNDKRTVVKKINSKDIQTEEKLTWEDGNYSIDRYNPDKHTIEKIESFKLANGVVHTIIIRAVYLTHDGLPTTTGYDYIIGKAKVTADKIKDEFGLYTNKYRIKFSYPKETGRKPLVIKEGTENDIERLLEEMFHEFGAV